MKSLGLTLLLVGALGTWWGRRPPDGPSPSSPLVAAERDRAEAFDRWRRRVAVSLGALSVAVGGAMCVAGRRRR